MEVSLWGSDAEREDLAKGNLFLMKGAKIGFFMEKKNIGATFNA